MVDESAWGGDEGIPGGDREWHFRDGKLTVRAYEDFVEGAIGGVVTAASIELARFTAEAPDGTWDGRLCVELGSGCGVVTSALLQLGARVVATEQPEFLEHLRWNQSLNVPSRSAPHAASSELARCEPLDWTSTESRSRLRASLGEDGADVVVGANCIYANDAVEPFLAGVAAITNPRTEVYICGVPQPPRDTQDNVCDSMLDTFLAAALLSYDCYLIGTGGNSPLPPCCGGDSACEGGRGGDLLICATDDVANGRSIATDVAQEHRLPVAALADGVWLLLSPGTPLPTWVQPLFRLPAKTAGSEATAAV